MINLNDYVYTSDLKDCKHLEKLADNPQTDVKTLLDKTKKFFKRYMEDVPFTTYDSPHKEFEFLKSDMLISTGSAIHMLLTKQHDGSYNTLAKYIADPKALYTLHNMVSDHMTIAKTRPSDFKPYILNRLYSELKENLCDAVNTDIDSGAVDPTDDPKYSVLLKFIKQDCALKPCEPVKFYQGKKYNLKESDLDKKDLQADLIPIADGNHYLNASSRLLSYFMYIAEQQLAQDHGLGCVIVDSGIWYHNLADRKKYIDEVIGQYWNNRRCSSCIFHYEPDKSKWSSCPINDNILHLHGRIDFY